MTPTMDVMTITTRAPQAAEAAKALKIVDESSNKIVCLEVLAIKDLLTSAHASFDPICAANHTAWQVSLGKRREIIEPLEQAETHLKRQIGAWAVKQQQVAQQRQREIEAAARVEQEAQLETEIEHAEAAGATVAEVEAIIDRPLPVVPVMAAPKPGLVKGVSVSTEGTWKGEITDVWAFMKYAVANNRRDLANLLTGSPTAVKGVAVSIKNTVEIPGLRVWCEPRVATRGSR